MKRVIKHLQNEKKEFEDRIDKLQGFINENKIEIEEWERKIEDSKENIKQIELSILQLRKE